MISTGSMVAAGKVYQNLMVDVKQSNEKLRVRAQNIVMMATDCTREQAADALAASENNAKRAITMILLGCSADEAAAALEAAHGHVRAAVEAHEA